MQETLLGKIYADQEIVVQQGEIGNCMFVVQSGVLAVIVENDGYTVQLRTLNVGDFFGEMALFEKVRRSATVKACGEARVLTIDKRTLLRKIKEDPLIAIDFMEVLCRRIRSLSNEYVELRKQVAIDTNCILPETPI
jgi:CRP/FNR family transcriptional regulator